MSDQSLLASLESWIEARFGVPTSALGLDPVPVLPAGEGGLPLAGVKIGEAAAVAARPDLVDRLRPVVASLPPDMLFAPLGCYDLARVTLAEGFGIWGPSWLLFGDETTVHPATDGRPVQVSEEDLADADRDVFWHTHIEGSMGRFAVYEDDRLVALATVEDKGDPVWEIGMDVAAGREGPRPGPGGGRRSRPVDTPGGPNCHGVGRAIQHTFGAHAPLRGPAVSDKRHTRGSGSVQGAPSASRTPLRGGGPVRLLPPLGHEPGHPAPGGCGRVMVWR